MKLPRRALAVTCVLAFMLGGACGGARIVLDDDPQKGDGGHAMGDRPPGDASLEAARIPLAPTCPDDAPWNGSVCQGAGYVACPGSMRFDDTTEGGACELPIVDSGPPEPPVEHHHEHHDGGARDAGPPLAIPRECEEFLQRYLRCNMGAGISPDQIRDAWRQMAQNRDMRARLKTQCVNENAALRHTCP